MQLKRKWEQYREQRYEMAFMHYIAEKTNYRFIQKLGYGSYGITYLLEDKDIKKKFVMKRLRAKGRKNKKIRNHFFFEMSVLDHLRDSHIPRIYGGGQIDDIPFFFMDYIDGKTFEQLIFNEKKKYTINQSLKIVAELFQIVLKIHEAGYVHRDLRIPNILSVKDSLYVIDFGLAVPIQQVNRRKIYNPKHLKTAQSDLYAIGHFLLFLLYSSYEVKERKDRPWQEELQLPNELEQFIEKILGIRDVFLGVTDAARELDRIINNFEKQQNAI